MPISLRHSPPTSTSLTLWLEKSTRSNVSEELSVVSGGWCSIHTGFGRPWKEITPLPMTSAAWMTVAPGLLGISEQTMTGESRSSGR